MNLLHNIIFAFRVDVGGSLVKDVNGAVMEQRSCQRQTLALTAGEIGCLFVQHRIESLFVSEEVGKIYLLQRLPERVISGIGPGHQQILPDGTLEKIAVMADVGEVFHQAFLADFRQRYTADGNLPAIALVVAHQNGGDGGFSTAGFAHDCGEAAPGERHVHAVEDLSVRLIGKPQPLAFDGAIFRDSLVFLVRLRKIQKPENLVGSRHAVHGDMEERTQQTHGQEEIRRQQKDQDAACQIHMTGPKLGSRQNDAQSPAAIGDEIHHGNGIELHGQHFHGDFPELLALLVHFPVLEPVCLIDFRGGQTLQVFQERIAQGRILSPVMPEQPLCPPLDQNDGHRDHRNADEQHNGAGEVHKAQHSKQRERSQHGIEKLGQICAEIGFQLVNTLHNHLHHFRCVGLFLIGRTQPQKLAVDPFPEGLLHSPGT